MSLITFNIGLSTLSRKEDRKSAARRILSSFEGRTVTDDDILKEEGGRPYFRQGALADFNISHSGDIVAVSYVRGAAQDGTQLRTGCDIQLVKERANTLRIAEQFFSAAEQKYILHDKIRFFEIWTLKECYIKLHGFSVFDMNSVPDFIDEFGRLNLAVDGISFFLHKINDDAGRQYVLAAAIKGAELKPEIREF